MDGLDEAASDVERARIASVINNLTSTYPLCRIVVTTRRPSYTGGSVLARFSHAEIAPLHDEQIRDFLDHWYKELLPGAGNRATAQQVRDSLRDALRERPILLRLARNPMMLTAIAIIHWEQDRLPDQRAELYNRILVWLAQQRPRINRLHPRECLRRLGKLALAMQDHRDGRQVQVLREWAAKQIAGEFVEVEPDMRVAVAREFLIQEESDSGIVESVGEELTKFWILPFQEALAARRLAAGDKTVARLLRGKKFFQPEWREVFLLLAGCLHPPRDNHSPGSHAASPDLVHKLFIALLDQLYGASDLAPSLTDKARYAGLLGAAVQDLSPYSYTPSDSRYHELMQEVLAIFDAEKSKDVPIEVAIEAAEALGQAGDPRLRQHNWIEIDPGVFLMGSQKVDPQKPNYDKEAEKLECPPVEVYLDAYRIGRYPVTVAEYLRFVEAGGYEDVQYWTAGDFGKFKKPESWEEQQLHPNRPVVGVTWYEAMAYASWSGHRLPTEAEWERAARGAVGRKYPWGNEPTPNPSLLNFSEGKIGHATPVGVYPQGATPEGIQDMAGNVWEWCYDAFQDKLRGGANPRVEAEVVLSDRMVRGGGWDYVAAYCRAAYRGRNDPGPRYGYCGFRLAAVQSGRQAEP